MFLSEQACLTFTKSRVHEFSTVSETSIFSVTSLEAIIPDGFKNRTESIASIELIFRSNTRNLDGPCLKPGDANCAKDSWLRKSQDVYHRNLRGS